MNDRVVGGGIQVSVAGIIVHALLVEYAWEIALRVTAFLGIALILDTLAWIGYMRR